VFTFISPSGFNHPKTRLPGALLGPCYKTGRSIPSKVRVRERVPDPGRSYHTRSLTKNTPTHATFEALIHQEGRQATLGFYGKLGRIPPQRNLFGSFPPQ